MNNPSSYRFWTGASLLVMALGLGAPAACSDGAASGDTPDNEETPDDVADGGTEPTGDDGGGSNPDMKNGDVGPVITPPTEIQGTETPVPITYWPRGVDLGVTDPDENFRAVIIFQLRNQAELVSKIDQIYDVSSPEFRNYMSASDFMSRYAPTTSTVDEVKSWLTSKGFHIARTARNRMMVQYSGTVRQFNTAFNTELHDIRRSETTWRAPAHAPIVPLDVPQPLIGKIKRLLMPDPEAEAGTLSPDSAPIVTTPPLDVATNLSPAQIAKAYGISDLYARGFKGSGMTIGVVGAVMFRFSDAQSMWQTFGINRANPIVVQTMEPIITRDLETSLDIQLAGAIAPEAEIIYYGGPNNSDTSLLYTYNEAIADARAQVLSDSFAHAEATTPATVALAYNEVSLQAAAMGITVLSASGDSNQVDVPSNSPYVTAVGGTNVELAADNSWLAEQSWGLSGCGLSRIFATPPWQAGAYAAAKNRRAVADVGVVVGPYWVKYLANWTYADGTSASTPVFAGIIALVNQSRKASGKPAVGLLNGHIYKHAATRAAFRDITQVGYGGCAVSAGYDLATGIGSPKAAELAVAIP